MLRKKFIVALAIPVLFALFSGNRGCGHAGPLVGAAIVGGVVGAAVAGAVSQSSPQPQPTVVYVEPQPYYPCYIEGELRYDHHGRKYWHRFQTPHPVPCP